MPSTIALPSTRAETPLPMGESKSVTGASAMPAFLCGGDDGRASGCSLARSTLAASRSNSFLVEAGRRHDGDHLRLAFGQRAGLVDDQRVDLLHALERLGIADQHAGCAPRPTPTMIDIGVARPSAQGHAMISTATAAIKA